MTGNHGELAEEVGVDATRGETDQVECPHGADTLWVLSNPLDDDFGRIVEASLLLHAVGDRGLIRGGSFVRRLPVQDVGEHPACWRSWRLPTLAGKPCSDRRLFGTDGHGGTTPTSRERNLSQRWVSVF